MIHSDSDSDSDPDYEWKYEYYYHRKLLKTCFIKKMVKYNFELLIDREIVNDLENEYCEWVGQYTIGTVSCRGTRLWLRTNAARSYEADSLFFNNAECKKTFYDALEKGESFPGDYCSLRSESLAEILSDLEAKTDNEFKYYKGTFENLMKILWKADKSLALNLQQADIDQKQNNNDILCSVEVLLNEDEDLGYESGHRGGNIWIIKENMKEKIINELKQVLKTCNRHNVLWEWN